MKINRKEFLGVLELAGKMPVVKTGNPIFDYVRFEPLGQNLLVTSSSYTTTLVAPVPIQYLDNSAHPSFMINRKLIIDTIKAMYDKVKSETGFSKEPVWVESTWDSERVYVIYQKPIKDEETEEVVG